MESTGRSKSFKALSMAQPIKKEIQQTLIKLQAEKRRFLAFERQENSLKETCTKKRKQLNSIRKVQPVTELNDKKTFQTAMKTKNADRTYERTLNNIQQLKSFIDVRRRQVVKYKQLNSDYTKDIEELNKNIQSILDLIDQKEEQNQNIKNQIVHYRQTNIKNLGEFRKSHFNLSRSNFKDENQRKIYGVGTKSFLGEEMKHSKLVHFDIISEELRKSGIMTNEGKVDIMTESVPLAKARVNSLIHKNKEKIRIAEEYKRFGEGLDNLFKVMREYKGRDDVDFLANEFVAKEKQIQKLGEYVGKLQYRIVSFDHELEDIVNKDSDLQKELKTQNINQSQKQYQQLSQHVKQEIKNLKESHLAMTEWLKKVGQILCPLTNDDDFSRGNAPNVIGKIEQKIAVNKGENMKKKQESKQPPVPVIEAEEHSQKYNQLLTYDSMKDYAKTYIKSKRS